MERLAMPEAGFDKRWWGWPTIHEYNKRLGEMWESSRKKRAGFNPPISSSLFPPHRMLGNESPRRSLLSVDWGS